MNAGAGSGEGGPAEAPEGRGLVLYGASELGRDALSVVQALEDAGRPPGLLGFVDDGVDGEGGEVLGRPVLGAGGWLEGREGSVEVLATIGDPRIRRKVALRLEAVGHAFATLIHPTAVLGPGCSVGEGSLVMAGTTVTVESVLGRHVVVNPGCTVAHDVGIGHYGYLSPGVDLAGRVYVDEGAYLGVGAVVLPRVVVGAGAPVGAGAVVTRDVAPDTIVAGVPAHPLRRMDTPWALPPDAVDAGDFTKGDA